jgi:transglycosylase-like protein with SLT domain
VLSKKNARNRYSLRTLLIQNLVDSVWLLGVYLRQMSVPFLTCMLLTASVYHLPPRVLPAILAVEGGRPGAVHLNKNQSEDLGVMQINTLWITPLARYTALPEPVVRGRLVNDACFNIAAAGLIMRTYLNETRGDLLLAVGNYHSHTPVLNQDYQAKVLDAARVMFPARS